MDSKHHFCNELDEVTPGSRQISWNFCAIFKLDKKLLGKGTENIFVASKQKFNAQLCKPGQLENQQINKGDVIMFASVGAGMNINAIVYQY